MNAIENIFDLEEATRLYYTLKEEADKVNKELKPINEQIKNYMTSQNQESMLFDSGFKIVIGTQNRSQVDQDKLVQILKANHLEDAIKLVEVPDELAVEKLVYLGLLPKEEYMKAVKENYIKTLKVVKK